MSKACANITLCNLFRDVCYISSNEICCTVCGAQHTFFVFYPVGARAACCGKHETRRACTCGRRRLYRMLISVSSLSLADTYLMFVMYILFTVFCLHSLSHILSLLHFYFISLPYVVNDRVARCDFLLSAMILGIDVGK
jgi:hypothetical protein